MAAPSDSSLYGSRDFDELLAILSPNNASNNAPSSANNSIVTGAINGAPNVSSDIDGRIASSASGRSSRSNRSLQQQFQQQHQQRSGGWTVESVESFGDSTSLPVPQTVKTDAAAGDTVRVLPFPPSATQFNFMCLSHFFLTITHTCLNLLTIVNNYHFFVTGRRDPRPIIWLHHLLV